MLTHTTYLDTTGRPTILFKYEQLTERHASMIYVSYMQIPCVPSLTRLLFQVSYKLPLLAHLRKPIAVTTAFLAFFVVAIIARRADIRIHHKYIAFLQ